jgi:carboxyl-terminal processing protease
MKKLTVFMKSRNGLIVTAILLFGGLFFAFRTVAAKEDSNELLTQQQRLLSAVGSLLKEQHYSPKQINDDFSRKVFKGYFDQLDNDKSFFLQADIAAVKKYETTIDDEINGAPLQFQPALSSMYTKRLVEAEKMAKEILAKPFDFTVNESVQLDGDKTTYPKDIVEQKERWRKKIKYYVLERYVDLVEQQEKNKDKKDFIAKPKDSLEVEARNSVLKIMERYFNRTKKAFTEEQRFNAFVNVVTNLMDPHTDYYPPLEKRAFDERMSNQFYGIGAQLQQDDNGVKIASIVSGYPAWKSGEIVVGDLVIKVAQGSADPVDIGGYDVEDAVKLIRGNKGTEVRLTIRKQDGSTRTVSLVREKIEQDEGRVRSAVIGDGDNKTGYIFLPDFYANFDEQRGAKCSDDVALEVEKLKAEKVKGIIIDLRNNGGGSLVEVVKMVGLFIKSGPIVQVKERDGSVDERTWRDNDESVLYDGPLTVMVNELSASASEIFAAAIQDYKRGIIIGSTSTYGKGTVQRPVPFGKPIDFYSSRTEYGAVNLTFQKFYRVNGGATQLKGVTPDIVMPDRYEFLKIREKDNESALPWDAIAATGYQPWLNGAEESVLSTISKKEQAKIAADPSLTLLAENLKWLSKNAEAPIPLQIDQFKAAQKQITTTVNQNNSLLKLKNDLIVNPIHVDKDKYYNNPDPSKGIRYQEWLKSLQSDLQIGASVQLVEELAKKQIQTVKN